MQDSIPFVPVELVTEILSRLPIKSLLRFKCTSKSWLALISSPEFVKKHISFNASNKEYTHHKVMMSCLTKYSFKDCNLSSLFDEYSVTEAKDFDYPKKSYRKVSYGVSIAGSANGLICLVIDEELFLWNPSIRKYKKLPHPTAMIYGHWRIYGFGYDEFHDDYKVVVILIEDVTDGPCKHKVKLYSLKSDSWKHTDDCPHNGQKYGSGKFLNGKLHWAANSGRVELATATNGHQAVISIDLANEKWGEMKQPGKQEGDINLRLGVLVESLVCPIYTEGTEDTTKTSVKKLRSK